MKSGGKVTLYSRRGTDLSRQFEYVASALNGPPDETVLNGEIVALDGAEQLAISLQDVPTTVLMHCR